MRETYSKVGEQTGKGSFDRMKAIMEEGVKVAAYRMYDKAATRVENELLVLQVCFIRCWPKNINLDGILAFKLTRRSQVSNPLDLACGISPEDFNL